MVWIRFSETDSISPQCGIFGAGYYNGIPWYQSPSTIEIPSDDGLVVVCRNCETSVELEEEVLL